jgi:hypothetical protein
VQQPARYGAGGVLIRIVRGVVRRFLSHGSLADAATHTRPVDQLKRMKVTRRPQRVLSRRSLASKMVATRALRNAVDKARADQLRWPGRAAAAAAVQCWGRGADLSEKNEIRCRIKKGTTSRSGRSYDDSAWIIQMSGVLSWQSAAVERSPRHEGGGREVVDGCCF